MRISFINKAISVAVAGTLLATSAAPAAPRTGEARRDCLAPASEAKKNSFRDLITAIEVLEREKSDAKQEAAAAAGARKKQTISSMLVRAEELSRQGQDHEALLVLRTIRSRIQQDFPDRVSLYETVLSLIEELDKRLFIQNSSEQYRKEFENFAGRPLSDITYKEIIALLPPFHVLLMRDRNKKAIELIAADGYFDIDYRVDLFYDPMNDARGAQRYYRDKYSVVVGGDAVIILRDDNGDAVVFQMDASGHGAKAAAILDNVVPLIYKRWEEREGEFLNTQLIADIEKLFSGWIERYGYDGKFITMNAVSVRAADGYAKFYSLGADPGRLISPGGQVQGVITEGSPLGLTVGAESPVVQPVGKTLRPGSRIVLFSDGVSDARISGAVFYGVRKFKELINRYVAEFHTLPAGEAADKVIAMINDIEPMPPEEQRALRPYVMKRAEAVKGVHRSVTGKTRLPSSQFNEMIVLDMEQSANIRSEMDSWNRYVDERLDMFLAGYKGETGELYSDVIADFAAFAGLQTLRADSYAGNSLCLLDLIRRNKGMPLDELRQLIARSHADLSRKPVPPSEIAKDDLTLVSLMYVQPRLSTALSQILVEAPRVTIRKYGQQGSTVSGGEFAGLFEAIAGSAALTSPRSAGADLTVAVSDKLVYASAVRDGVLCLNRSLAAEADKEMQRFALLAEKHTKGELTEKEFAEFKAGPKYLVLIRFIIEAKCDAAMSRQPADYAAIVRRGVSVYQALSRKDQDQLLTLMRRWRGKDRELEGFHRLLGMIRLSGIDQAARREMDRFAMTMNAQGRAAELEALRSAWKRGEKVVPQVVLTMSGLSGADLVDAGIDQEVQRSLYELRAAAIKEAKQSPSEELDRLQKEVRRIFSGMVKRQKESVAEQERNNEFIKALAPVQ
ncbi:MAG TPA: SpoIIE family protein phosphatase, partial [bacterium]|nr:SpoIIE family protein phosphatase [bacterium]